MPTAEKGGGGQTSDASNYPYNYLQRFDLIFANGQQMKKSSIMQQKRVAFATLALARPLKICIKCTRGQVQSYDKSL